MILALEIVALILVSLAIFGKQIMKFLLYINIRRLANTILQLNYICDEALNGYKEISEDRKLDNLKYLDFEIPDWDYYVFNNKFKVDEEMGEFLKNEKLPKEMIDMLNLIIKKQNFIHTIEDRLESEGLLEEE